MKANTVALSFGYMTVKSKVASDGINDLLELDLFTVTVTPSSANADTRFLGLKSAPAELILPSEAKIQAKAAELKRAAEFKEKRARPIQVATFEVDDG